MYRNNAVMPAHLAKNQRDMIIKPKYKKQLESEPVIANLSGEEFELKWLGTSKPSDTLTFNKAINLFVAKDWDNLPNLLEGLKSGGWNLMRKNWPMKLMIKALDAGRLDMVMESLRRVEDTGLRMKTKREAITIFRTLLRKAQADATVQDITKTLLWAEQAVDLMSDPRHALKRKYDDDPTNSPDVVALVLDIAAVRASKFFGGVDEDSKVMKWARRVAGMKDLPFEPFFLEDIKESFEAIPDIEAPTEIGIIAWLHTRLDVMHGMKLAGEILPGSPVAKDLQQTYDYLHPQLIKSKDALYAYLEPKGLVKGTTFFKKYDAITRAGSE